MNFQYLKVIKIKIPDNAGYIVKPVDFRKGSIDEKGRQYLPQAPLNVYFPENIQDYLYVDYINDFENILLSKGHKSSENIILILTYIFIKIREKSVTTEKAWSLFSQGMFTTARLHLEYPMTLDVPNWEETLRLPNYDIGKFDISTLKTKIINNTQSDFYKKYSGKDQVLDDLAPEKFSYRRVEERIFVFNVIDLDSKRYFQPAELEIVRDLYFAALTEQWFKDFWKELEDELIIAVALGGAYYSPKVIELLPCRGFQIGVYTFINNDPRLGWVIPLFTGLAEVTFDSQWKISVLNKKLKSFYIKKGSEITEFSSLIDVYVKLLGTGLRLLIYEDRNEEAFHYLWIALDTVLVLGTTATSNDLKNRIAALTWYQSKTNQKKQYDLIKPLYDKRCAYVHSGHNVPREDVLNLRDLAQTILYVLLNMHCYVQKIKPVIFKNWIENIDKIKQLSYNGQEIERELLVSTGIIDLEE